MTSFRVRYFSDIKTPSRPIWNAGFIKGYEVTPTGPYPNNSIISFNSVMEVWDVTTRSGNDASSLQGIPISSDTPINGQILAYNSSILPDGEWQLQPSASLSNNEFLVYNATSGVWDPAPALSYDSNGNLVYSNKTTTTGSGSGNIIFGDQAGSTTINNDNNVILGNSAMTEGSGDGNIRIGENSGFGSISNDAIAIGNNAGFTGQADFTIAIGEEAGRINQGANSIAIGNEAGESDLGVNTIAIGQGAGQNVSADNAIGLNATGSDLPLTNSGFYVAPIRDGTDFTVVTPSLYYDTTTKEIIYRNGLQEDEDTLYLNKPLDLSGVETSVVLTPGNNAIAWYKFIIGSETTDSTGNNYTLVPTGFGTTSYLADYKGRVDVVRTVFGPLGSHFLQSGVAAAVAGIDITLSTWFFLEPYDGTRSLYMIFYGDLETAGEANSLQIYLSNATVMGRLAVRYRGTGFDYTLDSTTTYDDGRWHHLAVVLTASQVLVYVDGSVITMTTTGTPPSDFQPLDNIDRYAIGAYYFGASPASPAHPIYDEDVPYLSNYIIFGSALSAGDITTLYSGSEICGPISVKGLLQSTGLESDFVGAEDSVITNLTITSLTYTPPHLVIRKTAQSITDNITSTIDFSTGTIISDSGNFTIGSTTITINVEGAYHYGYNNEWGSSSVGQRQTVLNVMLLVLQKQYQLMFLQLIIVVMETHILVG